MSNSKSSANHFKKIFNNLKVFDEDEELDEELDEEYYDKFKKQYKMTFAEYLEEWAEAHKEIAILQVKENRIM